MGLVECQRRGGGGLGAARERIYYSDYPVALRQWHVMCQGQGSGQAGVEIADPELAHVTEWPAPASGGWEAAEPRGGERWRLVRRLNLILPRKRSGPPLQLGPR